MNIQRVPRITVPVEDSDAIARIRAAAQAYGDTLGPRINTGAQGAVPRGGSVDPRQVQAYLASQQRQQDIARARALQEQMRQQEIAQQQAMQQARQSAYAGQSTYVPQQQSVYSQPDAAPQPYNTNLDMTADGMNVRDGASNPYGLNRYNVDDMQGGGYPAAPDDGVDWASEYANAGTLHSYNRSIPTIPQREDIPVTPTPWDNTDWGAVYANTPYGG